MPVLVGFVPVQSSGEVAEDGQQLRDLGHQSVKQPTPAVYSLSPPLPPAYPGDLKAKLQTAVGEYNADVTAAELEYGTINNWRPVIGGGLERIAGLHLRKIDKASMAMPSDNTRPCVVLPISAVMFKIGRCGSTLLTNMLQASSPTIRLVEEPSYLLRLFDEANPPSSEAIRSAFALHAHKAAAEQTSVFFNLQSQMWPHVARIRDALGRDVPLFFLNREPYQVAISLMERPPGWLGTYAGSNPAEQASSYINKALTALGELDMVIYDLADVQSLELPRWVNQAARKAAGRPSELLPQEAQHAESLWRHALDHDAKQPGVRRTGVMDDDLARYRALPSSAKEAVFQLMYSQAAVSFRLRHPYLARAFASAAPVLRQLKQQDGVGTRQNEPYVLASQVGESSLANWSAAAAQHPLPMLEAIGEPNMYAWTPNGQNCTIVVGSELQQTTTSNGAHAPTRWTQGLFADWQARPNWYLQTHISSVDSPIDQGAGQALAALTGRIVPASVRAAMCGRTDPELCHADSYGLRISHPGSVSPLHWDTSATLLMQTHGEKAVYLLPPGSFPSYPEGHCLARRSIWNLHCLHPVYRGQLDLEQGQLVTIRPGDVLFM